MEIPTQKIIDTSIISAIGKVFEKNLYLRIMDFLLSNNLNLVFFPQKKKDYWIDAIYNFTIYIYNGLDIDQKKKLYWKILR